MQHYAQSFLTEAEKAEVTEIVKKAELRTSGEIVPMIVSTSYDYPTAKILAALFYSLPATLCLLYLIASFFWLNTNTISFFFAVFLPLYFLAYLAVQHFPWLSRIFISRQEIEEEVREEATKNFFAEQLYKTRDANGILLFVSVFEKKVWILADHGINDKIDPGGWQHIVEELSAGIANKRRCEALCDALQKIGTILEQHFPYKKDDTDELHNLIIR